MQKFRLCRRFPSLSLLLAPATLVLSIYTLRAARSGKVETAKVETTSHQLKSLRVAQRSNSEIPREESRTLPVSPDKREKVLKTLLAGLKNRQQTLEGQAISGLALEKRFIGESYFATRVSDKSLEAKRQQGVYTDRDMALIRFNLSKDQWIHEVQQLLWSGWSRWFTPDYNRKATDVWDLYRRAVCDGNKVYWYGRYRNGEPTGYVEELNKPLSGFDQRFFRRWLSISIEGESFSELLAQEKFKNIEEIIVNGQNTYVLTYGRASDQFALENRVWISPVVGFAVTRMESLSINRADPKRGTRSVIDFSDFKGQPNLMLPHRCLEQNFTYEAGKTGRATLDFWSEMTFTKMQVQDQITLNFFEYSIPVGTPLDGHAKLMLRPETLRNIRGQEEKVDQAERESLVPWIKAKQFINTQLPDLNPAYTQPLTGEEIKALAAK